MLLNGLVVADIGSLNLFRKFFKEIGLQFVAFDGCMLGMHSIVNDMHIKKPWAMATNCASLIEEFQNLRCDKSHDHTPCAGRDTKATESYTFPMTQRIHKAFAKHVSLMIEPNKKAVAVPSNKKQVALSNVSERSEPTVITAMMCVPISLCTLSSEVHELPVS